MRRPALHFSGFVLAVFVLGGGALRVVAAAKPEAWLRLSTPDFTVITSLREKEARAWTGEFAQYVAAQAQFFHLGSRKLTPLTLVVFAREDDFKNYRPLDEKGQPQAVAGFFLRHGSWAVAGVGRPEMSEDVRRTIFHEGVHWFLSGDENPNPIWVEEGLAEVFSTFTVEDGQAKWGKAIDNHVRALHLYRPLPLEKLVYTAHSDLFHDDRFNDDSLHTQLVYAESWAFVHFLLFGKHDGVPPNAFATYAKLSHAHLNPDEAFRQAFGHTYQELDELFARYLQSGRYYVMRQPVQPVPDLAVSPAAPVEVADALGRLALAARRWEQASTHARAAIAAAADDPRGYEVLGMALDGAGDKAAARAQFELAVQHGSRDFLPYFELAAAEQDAAAADGAGSISGADARRIANRYEHAINLYPRNPQSYENLAGVIAAAEPVGPEDRKFFDLATRLYPDDAMIKVGLALLTWRDGDHAAARTQLDEVLKSSEGHNDRAARYARQIDDNWEQIEVFDRINQLNHDGKYAEGIAYIDERIDHGLARSLQLRLQPVRRGMVDSLRSQKIKTALDERRWADARAALNEVLESDASPQMKRLAQQTLADMDKKNLGK